MQRGSKGGEGGGHFGHAGESVGLLPGQGSALPARVPVLLTRRGQVPDPSQELPGAHQLHRHRLVPAMAARGARVSRRSILIRNSRARTRAAREPSVPLRTRAHVRQRRVQRLPRRGPPVLLHHPQVLPRAHLVVQGHARQSQGSAQRVKGSPGKRRGQNRVRLRASHRAAGEPQARADHRRGEEEGDGRAHRLHRKGKGCRGRRGGSGRGG